MSTNEEDHDANITTNTIEKDKHGPRKGYAPDAIAVVPASDTNNGEFVIGCSDFVCHFPITTFPYWLSFFSQEKTGGESNVDVYVNGNLVSALEMELPPKSSTSIFCRFKRGKSMKPHVEVLSELLVDEKIRRGTNLIKYIESRSGYCAEAKLFVWGADDHVILSDIDGTITRSDFVSVRDTIIRDRFSKIDFNRDHQNKTFDAQISNIKAKRDGRIFPEDKVAHDGVCRLFQKLSKKRYRFIYLTARPLKLIHKTRRLIDHLSQDSEKLPAGPIFCHPSMNVIETIIGELVTKSSDKFKADLISRQIKLSFAAAGRPNDEIFFAAFGNKRTDYDAYTLSNVKASRIFIINNRSEIMSGKSFIDDIPVNIQTHLECCAGGAEVVVCDSKNHENTKQVRKMITRFSSFSDFRLHDILTQDRR